ncbi:MAG: hypothetical protein CMO80_01100 [Verrucomicrobiales bacterium]|nr:hypothetical protein [Verrucomicrobiales bacterium]
MRPSCFRCFHFARQLGVFKNNGGFGQYVVPIPSSASRPGGRLVRVRVDGSTQLRGINGRRLELQSLDDGYEPALALRNTRDLIHTNGVFVLAGYVGTPMMRESLPGIASTGIPCIGPFTGAGFLRRPNYTNVINMRASYAQETEMWI